MPRSCIHASTQRSGSTTLLTMPQTPAPEKVLGYSALAVHSQGLAGTLEAKARSRHSWADMAAGLKGCWHSRLGSNGTPAREQLDTNGARALQVAGQAPRGPT